MRTALAIAELRLRAAVATRLPWMVVLTFAAGAGIANWAPGADVRARVVAAGEIALGVAAASAVLGVLVVAATGLATEVRTAVAQTLLATPLSRGALVAGGVLGNTLFGGLFVLALAGAATIGLDAGGAGTRSREPARPMHPARVLAAGGDGIAELGAASNEVRARFVVPDGLPRGGDLRIRFAPRRRIESSWDAGCTLEIGVARPGGPISGRRVGCKAGVAFETEVSLGDLGPGDEADVVVRRISAGWVLRFGDGSIEVGGARELFVWNLVKASACLVPLLALTAAVGAAASARLGAAAAIAAVSFLVILVAGRDVIVDGAEFVVEQGAAQDAQAGHDHAGHDHGAHGDGHGARVTPAQVALGRVVLAVMTVVPDARAFWRFDDLAASRATTPRDIADAFAAGLLPCAAVTAGSWLLFRKREILAS